MTVEPDQAEQPVGQSVPVESLSALNGLRVLVVDDEADARDLLATMLEQYGAAVRTCASSSEALETLQRYHPDVLVSDIGMPGEDGYVLI